ncbi:DUF6361 family protein [Ornithinimicrobium sp. LYQ121]|uniref:DUF6361 family protein n=1 Tax=Ornithinimicrobium sp. LYQ121 TaxID=3378801 RepID=UPI003852DDB7
MAWVDFGHQHRDDMDRLLDAFRDEATVDELGIGTIRDTFANVLFPGTSTLHTRARYLLFVPWLVTSVAAQRLSLERANAELRHRETGLIEALIAGDPTGEGVIGKVARASLKRMPSEVYWGALGRYRIRRCDDGPQQHFRAVTSAAVLPQDEEDERPRHLHDPHFCQLPPVPDDLETVATFDLTADEADFLNERIQATCQGSYLAWLLLHRTPGDTAHAWDEPLTEGLDGEPARVVAHAQRLHHLYEGAPLLYNLLLARNAGWDEGVDAYEHRLTEWGASEGVAGAASGWDQKDFWALVLDGRRVNAGTRDFVNAWVHLVRDDKGAAWRSAAAAGLIEEREKRLKRSRSRFVNTDALELWQGGAGVGGLSYRWRSARTLINDIRRGQRR